MKSQELKVGPKLSVCEQNRYSVRFEKRDLFASCWLHTFVEQSLQRTIFDFNKTVVRAKEVANL